MHWSQLHGSSMVPMSLQPFSPLEWLPARQQRSRLGTHVGEDHPRKLFDLICLDLYLFLEATVGVHRLLERLLNALASLVEHPTVVHTAETVLLWDAVREIDAAVRAQFVDQAQRP